MARKRKNKTVRYSIRNKVELVTGGKPYFDCLSTMIRNAEQSIHLQVYIFDDDETGHYVAMLLKEAVSRDVEVYLLIDGFQSRLMTPAFITELINSRIHFRLFNPIFRSRQFYFGRRLHQKVLVVDAAHALVGGINIADRYNDMPGQKAWLDFALYVEGEAAAELCEICWKGWYNYSTNPGPVACEPVIDRRLLESWTPCEVAIRRNDWVRRKNEISATYIEMLRKSRRQVIILCSYFLPGRIIRKQLSYAIERGVSIKVITAGSSDVLVAKNAEKFMYDWLLKNEIELYEYQPAVLHGKIAVCDGEWMTVGSYNINNISAYASIELNVNVRNGPFAGQVEDMLLGIIEKDCVRVTREDHARTKNLYKRFVRWSSYMFVRIAVYLFTFYFKHRD